MLKYLFFCLTCVVGNISLHAQGFKFNESSPIPEPEEGWLQLLHFKNGNTALIHVSYEEGINIKIFDPNHKLSIDQNVKPKYTGKGKFSEKSGNVIGICNVAEDIVVFVNTVKDSAPVLIRIIIDGQTGVLKTEEDLIHIVKARKKKSMIVKAGMNVPVEGYSPSCFQIRKDPNSDNYGVSVTDYDATENDRKIEFIHYDSKNQLISRSFFTSDDNLKSSRIVDFLVLGDGRMIASVVMSSADAKEERVYVGVMEKGAIVIKKKQIDYSKTKHFAAGLLRYNDKANLIAMVGLNELEEKKSTTYYNSYVILIDPSNLSIVYTKDIDMPDVRDQYKKLFGDKNEFNAVPQNFYINADGTYTVVFEELSSESIAGDVRTGNHTMYKIRLGSVAVAVMDDKMKTVNSYLIPKAQEVTFDVYGDMLMPFDYRPFYPARRQVSAQPLRDASQFKSFAYVSTKNGNYVLMNELNENIENISQGRKLNAVNGVSGTDALVNTLAGTEIKREFLFGKQASEKSHAFFMVTVLDYDPATGTLVTLKLEKNKDKKLKVIWLKL